MLWHSYCNVVYREIFPEKKHVQQLKTRIMSKFNDLIKNSRIEKDVEHVYTTGAEEEWRDVVGFEGLYLVSNFGKVYSLHKKGLLKPKDNKGYYNVVLCKNGKRNHKIVHRLVAEAFIPNPNGWKEINHKDENKVNNHVDNLEWCDSKYNLNYGKRRSIAAQHTKKPILQCDLDGNIIKEWDGAVDASTELNINFRGISRCAHGLRKQYKGFKWYFKEK